MSEDYRKKVRESIIDQIELWEKEKAEKLSKKEEKKGYHPFVTISREYGCGGYETAVALAGKLSVGGKTWAAYDRLVIDGIMKDMGLSRKIAETLTTAAQGQMTTYFQGLFANYPPQVTVHRKVAEMIRTLAVNGFVVIVGRGGAFVMRDLPRGFHVRLVAPLEWRVERISRLLGVKTKEAERTIAEKSGERDGFYREYLKFDTADPVNFDIVINNARYDAREAAEIIAGGMAARKLI